tara:strand:- start:543 stop:1121 length:579 start_codon:yes stop_codon:yes gene_type:complete
MIKNHKNKFSKLSFFKFIIFLPLIYPFHNFNLFNEVKAGIEFQWDNDPNFRRLKWYQTDPEHRARNTIYFFLRPSDRRTGLLKINMKFPETFKTNIKKEKINLCRVNIGGFDSKTKCLENIPSDFELNKEDGKLTLNIFPYSPLPSSKDSYAVVLKVFNPYRSGLYQFHSYGQSSGQIPVTSYIGTWTIVID